MNQRDDAWLSQFPPLDALGHEERTLLCGKAAPIALPAGTTVFEPNGACGAFLFV